MSEQRAKKALDAVVADLWARNLVELERGLMLTLTRGGQHTGVVLYYDEDEDTMKAKVEDFQTFLDGVKEVRS